MIDAAQLLADPAGETERLARFLRIEAPSAPTSDQLRLALPQGIVTGGAPPEGLDAAVASLADIDRRVRELFAHTPRSAPVDDARRSVEAPGFRSVSTSNLAPLLAELVVTPIATTYQSGRVIAVRSDGERINTHFRMFDSPMGVALGDRTLALGTKRSVWELRDVPAAATRLAPPGAHDACFVPARSHVTGDVAGHELAFAGGELWLVATRFSCLATLDDRHSFVPRWRPPFVSALAAEDRCHLNGMAVVDDRIAYVTALGATDEPSGWRARKSDSGVVVDVESGEVVAAGLSMPHSPRWHDSRLWVLESGQGRLCTIDLQSGRREVVADVPGFARGLAFAGPLAFIGLSQVRESVFHGIPLTERLDESQRRCGVWVVDTGTGATVAFLRFEGAVQEIFDVQLLRGVRWPELVEPDDDLTGSTFVLP